MFFNKLRDIESQVKDGDKGNFKLKPFSIPIKDEDLTLKGYTIRPSNGYSGYYYDEKIPKEKIVLHFTAGHLRGDVTSLTLKERGHVSVPFIIARDGNVYQLFSSAAWSYHLGRAAIGGNSAQSKKSIAIEISNVGPLDKKGNMLRTWFKKDYCSLEDTDKYIKLDKPYRGCRYFADYTKAQYDSLITLLRYLTNTYNIPREFLDIKERFEATEKVIHFKGILSHVNYRKTGKTDLGPAFDWDYLIKGVQDDSFSEEKRIASAIEATKKELEAAYLELQTAEHKVSELEQKIQDLENTPMTSRSIEAPSGFNSEEAIEAALPTQKDFSIEKDYGAEGPDDEDSLLFDIYQND